MFIFTAKLPRRKLALGTAAAAFLCCAALSLLLHPPEAVSAVSVPDFKGVRNNRDRIEFLTQYGWQVSEQPTAVQELQIPDTLGESYQDYLSLQASQGFDLNKYTGKQVRRYTYEVLNYPTGEQGVSANLLLYRHTVVGGEILSPSLNGFLHGLTMP